MAAFDFPPTPAVGTLYPAVAEVGKPQYRWNGNEWVAATFDPAGYVKRTGDTMTGALSLAGDPTQALHAVPLQYLNAQKQRIPLAGGRSFDVQVPAGAIAVRLTIIVFAASATDITPFLQFSLAPGVFLGTGNYASGGFLNTSTASTVIGVSNVNYNGILISNTHANAALPMMTAGLVTLKRPSTTQAFTGDFSSVSYATGAVCHMFMLGHISTAQTPLNVLALRILSATGDNWADGSLLTAEWIF